MENQNRLETLKELVQKDPDDDFSRYGLALEYKKMGEAENAFQEFDELINRHPDYVPAYFMYGQYLFEEDQEEKSIEIIQQGIEVAQRVGDHHAAGEMQDFLSSIQ